MQYLELGKYVTSATGLPVEDQSRVVRFFREHVFSAQAKVATPNTEYPPGVMEKIALARSAIKARYKDHPRALVKDALAQPWVMIQMPFQIKGVAAVMFFGHSIQFPKGRRFDYMRQSLGNELDIGIQLGDTHYETTINGKTLISPSDGSYTANIICSWELHGTSGTGDYQTEVLFAKGIHPRERLIVENGILMFPSIDLGTHRTGNEDRRTIYPSQFLYVNQVREVPSSPSTL
jgi:hypothetical protein